MSDHRNGFSYTGNHTYTAGAVFQHDPSSVHAATAINYFLYSFVYLFLFQQRLITIVNV